MIIALVIPTLTQGGAERVMSELANEWSYQGHEIHLILLAKHKRFYKIRTSVIVHHLNFENKNAVGNIISEIRTFFKLHKILKEKRPDFVLSFMEKYNILTILASRFLGTKTYVSDRSGPYRKIPTYLKFLRKITYRFADGIIAQTNLASEVVMRQVKNNNITVIPNPLKKISLRQFPKREKLVLNIGRLVFEKGQDYLLEAFAMMEDNGWKLAILGEGPLKETLIKKAKDLNIDHKVIMPGAVENVDEWIAKASIFAFPSLSEGYPNALTEAMAGGLACIAFDCDAGPREIINNGKNGLLVPLGDVKRLNECIQALISDEYLRSNIATEAQKIFDEINIEKISAKYLSFCNS